MPENTLQKLLDVMKQLRSPLKGCPWDRQQTHESLMPYFFEELHEFKDALISEGPQSAHTHEELGDVLFQVVFHCQLLSEKGSADFNSIADHLATKLIERHPHVFDPKHPGFQSSEEVNRAWEDLKSKNRSSAENQNTTKTAKLKKISKSLPALQRAARIGEKAASFGLDWKQAQQVLTQLFSEVEELKEASQETPERFKEELGDLLFSATQLARHQGWDPEQVLEVASQKFLSRFEKVEELLNKKNITEWKTLSEEELENTWKQAKKELKPYCS